MDCNKCQIEDEYIEEGWLRKAVVKFCPLHAAAPELLAELKNAVARASFEGVSRARIAIAKAEGK